MLAVGIIFCIIILVIQVITKVSLNGQLNVFIIQNVCFYPLLGYYLDFNYKSFLLNKKKICIMLLVILLSCLCGVLCNYLQIQNTTNKLDQGFLDTFNLLNCIYVYMSVRYFSEKI